jgi:hypothetical protein
MSRHASASRDSQHRCKRRSRHSPSQLRYHYRKSGRPAASSRTVAHSARSVAGAMVLSRSRSWGRSRSCDLPWAGPAIP